MTTDDANTPTPVRLWIFLLYAAVLAGFLLISPELRGSSVAHVNTLKSAHLIASFCGIVWAMLIFRGLIDAVKSLSGRSFAGPESKWFFAFALLSVGWLYLFIGELSPGELFFEKPYLGWLDPNNFLFDENVASICKQMENPPEKCTADWFSTSDIRNRMLVPAYSKAANRLITLCPALLFLSGAWIYHYSSLHKRFSSESEK